jgi:hypothetical protein
VVKITKQVIIFCQRWIIVIQHRFSNASSIVSAMRRASFRQCVGHQLSNAARSIEALAD